MVEPKGRAGREPTPWESAPQSSGLTFEGSIERLRFLSGKGRDGAGRHRTRLTLGFKLTLFILAAAVIGLAAVFNR